MFCWHFSPVCSYAKPIAVDMFSIVFFCKRRFPCCSWWTVGRSPTWVNKCKSRGIFTEWFLAFLEATDIGYLYILDRICLYPKTITKIYPLRCFLFHIHLMVHLASKLWIIFQPPFPPHHWDGLVAWYLPKSCYLRSCQSWFSHRFIGWGSWGPCHHWMTQWVFSVDEISISNLETMVILGKNYFTLFYFRFALRDTDIGRLWLIWLSTMVVQMICFFFQNTSECFGSQNGLHAYSFQTTYHQQHDLVLPNSIELWSFFVRIVMWLVLSEEFQTTFDRGFGFEISYCLRLAATVYRNES